jgi:hypothetical protein
VSPARRSRRKQDWPARLYEPRPGYYCWRHPDGRTFPIGRVPLAVARNEAIAANTHVAEQKPGLVERLSGASNTVAQLLEKMQAPTAKSTGRYYDSLDRVIVAGIGAVPCGQLDVRACAELLEGIEAPSMVKAVRSRLSSVCKRGMQLGWMESNPAEVTAAPKYRVQRGRLTLDAFMAIYAKAPEVCEWLQQAMRLAIVTAADRSTIASMERKGLTAESLTFTRQKTGIAVQVPLYLRLDVVGWSLSEVVNHRTGVVSRFLLHHVNPWAHAPAGSPVHVDRITNGFTAARRLAGIPDDNAPTFHEIRSLSKRLYEAQGGVDTKALLGHRSEQVAALYADPRGSEPVRVAVKK